MSSAILYLAIVAIWAGVLIPRWLRRDSARGAVAGQDQAAPGTAAVDAEFTEAAVADDADAEADGYHRPAAVPRPVTAEEARRRMLAARRRLLGMLVALQVAAVALAVLALAAMWVVIPPTLMLGGYLLLLREASKADAEHAAAEAESRAAEARAVARRRARERARVARRAAGVAAESSAQALAARFAAAPVTADYEDSGRDFAPGLAGKYTTSQQDYEDHQDREDREDREDRKPRLRAVGD